MLLLSGHQEQQESLRPACEEGCRVDELDQQGGACARGPHGRRAAIDDSELAQVGNPFWQCYSCTGQPSHSVFVFEEVKAFITYQAKLSKVERLAKRGSIATQVNDLASKLDDRMKIILASILLC